MTIFSKDHLETEIFFDRLGSFQNPQNILVEAYQSVALYSFYLVSSNVYQMHVSIHVFLGF